MDNAIAELSLAYMADLQDLFGTTSTNDLFGGAKFTAPKPATPPPPPTPPPEPASREDRLLFIGNVNVTAKKKALKKLFEQFGAVEKVWTRSVPVDRGKLPIKDAWAKKQVRYRQLVEGGDSCNCYVLYEEAASAEKAVTLNGAEFSGAHLRVDWACGNTERDYKRCVFVGNIPYTVKDDELRTEFSDIGEVEYVRVIRDPETHLGKGFAYVCYDSRDSAKRALSKHGAQFCVRCN